MNNSIEEVNEGKLCQCGAGAQQRALVDVWAAMVWSMTALSRRSSKRSSDGDPTLIVFKTARKSKRIIGMSKR